VSLDAPSIALVGAGAMGGALVRGWIEAVRKGGALTLSIVDPNFDPEA
jgi:pyrroline-5-carboxylate reductase